MIRPDLDAIDKRTEAATEGPWYKAPIFKNLWPDKFNQIANVRGIIIHGPYASTSCGDEADFIIHARTDVPAMSAYIKSLEKQVGVAVDLINLIAADNCHESKRAREALAEIEKLKQGDEKLNSVKSL